MTRVSRFLSDLSSYGTDWLYVFVPILAALGFAAWLVATGERGPRNANALQRLFHRAGSSLERVTGLPAWTAGGLLTGGLALIVAVVGFVWDVAWHVDLGRDDFVFTPGHVGILLGLSFILGAAVVSILMATIREADVAWKIGHIRIPRGAAALGVLGAGALVGFPLDELWHRAYGVDVTMWGPTHLIMISGASLTPLALWLLLTEAGPGAGRPPFVRQVRRVLAGATLVGMSTWQLEFDLGVPQFQQLYHPVLIAMAAAFALSIARVVLGRGGALKAVAGFLAIRAALAVLVGPVLGHTLPRFPLYVGAAIAVEAAFWLARRVGPVRAALAAGAAVGTFGLAAEWGWMQVWGRHPWGPSLVPGVLVAAAIAIPAALLGTAVGRVVSFRPAGVPRRALLGAGVAVIALLAIPLPRTADQVRATMRTEAAGPGLAVVELDVRPPDALEGADWFESFSWQGGGSRQVPMVRTGPGRYVTAEPVPVGGDWKTLVRFARHDVLQAVPVWMPLDEEIGAPEIPVEPVREVQFVRDTSLLMREAHAGPVWPSLVAYGFILGIAVVWFTTLALGFAAVNRRLPPSGGPLTGRRVVVTGASGGIGEASVRALRAEGAEVVGVDVRPGDGIVAGDVTDPASMRRAMREAAARLGGIDVLVNNAGIGSAQRAGEMPDAAARATVEVNVLGTWIATAAAMPFLMESTNRPWVVNVGSGLAVATAPYSAAYAASKRGVSAYSDVLRQEHRGTIGVTTVHPGYVRTSIHRAAESAGVSLEGLVWADTPEAAAAAIVRACVHGPRETSTSLATSIALRLARLFPRSSDAVIAWRTRRVRMTPIVTAPAGRSERPASVGVSRGTS